MNTENSNTDKNPFGIPEGYFEGFEASIEARLAEDELREIISSTGFAVPDGYFSGLDNEVMAKLVSPETKVIPLFGRKTLYVAVSVAAALLLIVTIFNKPVDPLNQLAELDNIDTETLQSYINSDAIAFSDAELIDFVATEDIETNFLNQEDITDEMLETYLLENLDDIDLITTYEE